MPSPVFQDATYNNYLNISTGRLSMKARPEPLSWSECAPVSMQSLSGNCLCSPPIPGLHALLRHLTARLTSRRRVTLPVRSMRLAWRLGLVVLVGLTGCGPAPSDHAPGLEPRVSLSGPPPSKQGPSPHNDSFTPVTSAANPVPLASVNGTDVASGMGTLPGEDRLQRVSAPSPNPDASRDPDDLLYPAASRDPDASRDLRVVPDWMAKELDSPDVGARLQALETWAQSAPPGAVDPLIVAYENDTDKRVRERALELLEQDLAKDADAEEASGE